MFYNKLITIALCLCASHVAAYQKPVSDLPIDTSMAGFITYGQEKLESLKSTGKVTLNGTQVSGPVEVSGSLSAQDAKMGPLNVNGHAYLENSKISGPSNIVGFFSADKCSFDGDLNVKAHKITLRDTTCGNITMQKVMWPFSSQVVELVGKTVCKGNITFESGKGRVYIRDQSNFKGTVIGGNQEKEIKLDK